MPHQGKQPWPSVFHSGVSHEEGAPVLAVSQLSVRYQGKPALVAVSFQLGRGERVAVIGPNGAGKSTLFKAIAGLLPISEGQVQVYGHAPGGHICIAYVPQRSQIDWSFPVNVFDVVMMGRTSKIGLVRWPGRNDKRLVHQCLDLVGMADLAGRQIGELSGGQQQRVFIARALAQEAQLMLMDEPLTGLDVPAQNDILAILETLRERQVTILVATHDLNQAAEHFDHVLLLNRRLFGFGAARDVLTMENLAAAYGGHLRVLEGPNAIVMADTCCEGGGCGD
jgi:manganese/iron transport system ATP-binding protein